MKLTKILALMLGVFAFASCSDNDDTPGTNSAKDVTVEMAQDQISFLESRGIVKVPVKVTGDPNGYVTVTCTVEEYGNGTNPAMEKAHYLMTSKTINIADDEKQSYFELRLIDDREVNDTRYFKITLIEARGASIGSPSSTIVMLEDNDNKPYDRLDGEWYMVYESSSGALQSRKVSFRAYESDHWAYGYSYRLTGVFGEDVLPEEGDDAFPQPINVFFNYDEQTEEGSLRFSLDQSVGYVQPTSGVNCLVKLWGLDDEGYIITKGNVTMTWNEDISELYIVSAPSGQYVNLAPIYEYDNGYYLGDNILWGVSAFYRERPNL